MNKNQLILSQPAGSGSALIGLLSIALLLVGCSGDATMSTALDPAPLPQRSNILLITIDTLRADHLSAYGYPRATSPTLDALARDGVRFDRPVVQWPKTGPSFASMFTSTYPKDNQIVRRIGIAVPEEYTLLAERLQQAGYDTRAVVSNGALSSELHFDQGFDHYIETWQQAPDTEIDPDGAERVTDLALELAESLDRERPFFLWVHYLDPHFPYTPPEPWGELFVDDSLYDPTRKISIDWQTPRRQMLQIGSAQVLDGRDEAAFYEARYDGEIAYTDSQIRRLLDALSERGLMDGTLTVVTSDHGESLGEHEYYFDHGRFAFQTCLRVPLIFHYPGTLEPRVVAEPAELLHLSPTLLAFAGILEADGVWMQGESLVPNLLGEPPAAPMLAFSEAGYAEGGRWQRVVQDKRFKLIYARDRKERQWLGEGDDAYVLYDLERNPEETHNSATDLPQDARRLSAALTAWLESSLSTEMIERSVKSDMDEKTREQLKALGYLN